MRSLLTLVLIACFGAVINAQENNFMFLDVKAHGGVHLYLSDDLETVMNNHEYAATEIRLGWQSDGSKGWEHNYNYPSFGVGWYSGFIGNKKILGNPNAFYGFVIFPLSPQKRHVWVSEFSLGLTYDLHKFDPQTNPFNDAIGSEIAVYFNYSFGGRYNLSDRWDLIYGIDLTHMSNGRFQQPNFGLNMGGVNVGLSYHFNRPRDKSLLTSLVTPAWCVRPECTKPKDEKEKIKEVNRLMYWGIGGSQNYGPERNKKRYFQSSLVLEYQRFFYEKHGVVLGMDLFFDGCMRQYLENPFEVGVHTGYDYRMSRLTMRFHLGTYLYAPERKGGFFMRPALKYDINSKFFAQLGLKTKNGLVADWLELGIGVRL